MIERMQSGGALARSAIEAALKSQAEAARSVAEKAGQAELRVAPGPAQGRALAAEGSFSGALAEGLKEVHAGLLASERLPVDLVTGKVTDFAELAAQLKQSELAFKFALEVRNKLIDAYRETMRMSV